jgi:glycosyltransferase involved in cell wall biosynthesis
MIMRICVIGKYPPIEGGVSAETFWTARLLAAHGHDVHVVTNAAETEAEHRMWFLAGDADRLESDHPGGRVRVHFTQAGNDADRYYIPAGQPTVTRLAGVATEVTRGYECDLIIGWYLEPYGVAAGLAAHWTGRPYVLRHAGSDLFALAADAELAPAYRELIRHARGVMTYGTPLAWPALPAARAPGLPGACLPEEFTPDGPALDIAGTAAQLAARGCPSVTNVAAMPAGAPVIGCYGKLGPQKGTIELIHAVGRLRKDGLDVQLALMGGGRDWPLVMAGIRQADLGPSTWTLPPLAPWRVPGFIRACQAIAYLERDFAVAEHMPIPPFEVVACGRPLVLSDWIARKCLRGRLADAARRTVDVVSPRDQDALGGALRRAIERGGGDPSWLGGALQGRREVARWYDSMFQAMVMPAPRSGSVDPAGRAATAKAALEVLAGHCPAITRRFSAVLDDRTDALADPGDPPLLTAFMLADELLTEELAAAEPATGSAAPLPSDAYTGRQVRMAEHHALWTRVDVEGRSGQPLFPVPVYRIPDLASMRPEDGTALRPVTSSWTKTRRFTIDIAGYLNQLGQRHGQEQRDGPGIARAEAHAVLFHKRGNLVRGIYRLNEATAFLLAASDGSATVEDIARCEPLAGTSFTELWATVTRLHDSGVIAFARVPVISA